MRTMDAPVKRIKELLKEAVEGYGSKADRP